MQTIAHQAGEPHGPPQAEACPHCGEKFLPSELSDHEFCWLNTEEMCGEELQAMVLRDAGWTYKAVANALDTEWRTARIMVENARLRALSS